MTTPALIAFSFSVVAWLTAVALVVVPIVLRWAERRFSGPPAGEAEEIALLTPRDRQASTAPALARYPVTAPLFDDQALRAWDGPVLPDAGLCGLARRDAMVTPDWSKWDRSGADGMGGLCEDPGQPWRAGE